MQSTRPPNRTGLPFTFIPSGRADLRTNFPSSHSTDKHTSGPSLPPAPSLSPLDRNGQTLEPEGHSFPLSTLIDSRRWEVGYIFWIGVPEETREAKLVLQIQGSARLVVRPIRALLQEDESPFVGANCS